MATRKPSKAEVAFALTFLRAAGIHNAHTRAYLIVAVIAWRREGMKFDAKLWQSAYRVLAKLKKVVGGRAALRTLLGKTSAKDEDQRERGTQFLNAVASSFFDAHHYGMEPGPYGSFGYNRLYAIYYKLLGTKGWSIPQPQPKPPPAPKPPKPKYIQPGSQLHPVAKTEYIAPYAAYRWYMERNAPADIPPADLLLD